MNNEELIAKYKALFPDNVEAIVVRKDDYDRLYGDLTIENIELKQEIEKLNKCIKDDKENADEIMAEQQQEIQRLNNIINELNDYCFQRMSELNDIQERDEKLQDFCDNKINAFIEVREKIKDLKGEDKE